MDTTTDPDPYAFFEKRLGATYALSEDQKKEILSHRDELDEERLADILKIIVEYVGKVQ